MSHAPGTSFRASPPSLVSSLLIFGPPELGEAVPRPARPGAGSRRGYLHLPISDATTPRRYNREETFRSAAESKTPELWLGPVVWLEDGLCRRHKSRY